MLHTDVVPTDPNWLDTLVDESEKVDADVLSAHIAIKNNEGLVSTARETDDIWRPKQYQVSEILEAPETFTNDKLLVNSGLMLCDMRKNWCEKVCFRAEDAIINYAPAFQPEDWTFSRDVRAQGGKIFATRKVKVNHWGSRAYGT